MGTLVFVLDNCRFLSTTTGTGAYSQGATPAGYLAPASTGAVSGRLYTWRAESEDGGTWELFEGAWTSGSPSSVARSGIIRTSAGGTTAINWPAGTRRITCVVVADRVPVFDTDGLLPGRPGVKLGRVGSVISIPASAATIVTFDTTSFGDLPGGTSPTAQRIRVSVPGKYDLRAQVFWADNSTGQRRVEIIQTDTAGNNVVPLGADARQAAGDSAVHLIGEAEVVSPVDFLLRVTQSSGAALNLLTGIYLSAYIR